MQSMLRQYSRLFPLFLCVICTICLGLAVVPGRLESYIERNYSIFILSIAGRYLLYIGLSIWAGVETIAILRRDRSKIKISGIISLTLVILTSLILSCDLPARLYFHTSVKEFDRVLVRQELIAGKAEQIGNFDIQEISIIAKGTYFITTYTYGMDTKDRYGFAYLPDSSQRNHYIQHINEKWYIFKCFSNPDRADYCQDYRS
jgi:hypothetical protein